ncbi:MAG: CHAT domain-containing protein [Lewinellaceae bacterium]|nr:CHAT domain-containing protein [Lewinellaceae bacterium]
MSCIFLLLFAPGLLPGQSTPPEVALEQAGLCIQSEEYPAARELFLEALPYYIAKGDYRRQAYIYLWLSEASYYARDIQQAIEEAEYSLLLAESCLDPDTLSFYCTILQNLGVFHSALSNFEKQMAYYQRSLEAALHFHGRNSERAADAYLSMGAAYGRRGKWSQCIAYTETSLKIAGSIGYQEGIGSALLNLSHSFAQQEDFEKAIQHQKRALAVTTSLEERARGLNNLGTYYIDIGEYAEALENLYQALHLRRELYLPSDGNVFSTLLNISRAHSESGNLDSAGLYLKQAIDGLSQEKGEGNRGLLQIARNYQCKLLLLGGLPVAAEEVVRRALAARGNWRDINSSSFMLLGEALLAQGRFQEALEAAQEGLQWAAPGFDAENPMENPRWESLESIAQARGLLKLKGDILREAGLAREEPALLKASLATFEQGDSLATWLRNTYQSRLSRDQIAANANALYAGALHTLYHLYGQTSDTLYFDQALAFSEKNKALSVLENLNSLYARSFSGIPEAVTEAERQLLEEIEFYSNLVKTNRGYESDSLLKAWEDKIFIKRREQDSLLGRIRVEYPRYYQMKHGFQLAAVEPLQEKLLAEGETMVEYFRDGDTLFVFMLSREQRRFLCLPSFQLEDKILRLCRAAVRQEPEFDSLSFELYKTLIQPLEPYFEGEKLAIVPDNVLAYLPFELLLEKAVTAASPHSRRPYLLRKYSIRYLFSANAALQAQYNMAIRPGHKGILALAPAFETGETAAGPGFSELPGARSELDSLEEAYRGLFLRGAGASEANFRQNCRDYGVYHIATHTNIDQRLPSASYLLMSKGEGEDGRLHVFELYNTELNAGLAVLSACNTGIGEIRPGEGSASLAHAFAYAGCADLVMSLWPVRDRTTPILVGRYYDNLSLGMEKCEALRQAKLYCLEYDELFAHPYFWSGFIYVGSRDGLRLPKRWKAGRVQLLTLAGLILAGLTIFLIWRRRR